MRKVLFDLAARRAQQLMQATHVMGLLELSWFNGNRTFELFMINHHERRKVYAKEALQLQL
jgi:hypothetical protein